MWKIVRTAKTMAHSHEVNKMLEASDNIVFVDNNCQIYRHNATFRPSLMLKMQFQYNSNTN